jgi:hypothetical protein
VEARIAKVHARSRQFFHLPLEAPRDPSGINCNLCVRECLIPSGEVGYCAVRQNIGGSLLAFHPQLFLHDLPVTSRQHAEQALAAARGAGLTRIHLGNRHLLGAPYEGPQ